MIIGIGTDLIEIERIENIYDKYKEKFLNRVFSKEEIKYSQSKNKKQEIIKSLSARFAAKEAFSKALGTGFRDGINMKDISVSLDEYGKPDINVEGKSVELMKNMGINGIHVSLSHVKDYATAMVVLEKND